jgi:hypothetical protein
MAKKTDVVSHWYHLIEGLQESPKDFYSSLDESIKKREIPDVSLSRIDYLEGGVLSAKREYLRVKRKNLIFDVCAAPFGRGFFVSWWLGKERPSWGALLIIAIIIVIFFALYIPIRKLGMINGLLLAFIILTVTFWILGALVKDGSIPIESTILGIPILGRIYESFFQPITYYKIDTELMFQESVRLAVLETVDQITKVNGIRSLSEFERKPILTDLLKR